MSSWKHVERWQGGYVRQRVDDRGRFVGRPTFVIDRVVAGTRFHVSTRAHDLGTAMRHLTRFEANPAGYSPSGMPTEAAVHLGVDLILEYFEHQLAKGQTREWAEEVSRCLGDWADVIGHLDFRRLSLHHDLKPALDTWPKRKAARMKALKGFARWLRTERGLLRHAEDATLDLRVPQARPEKWSRRKIVPPEHVTKVLRVLAAPFRDMLHLLTATAWHVTEVRRFVESGELVRLQPKKGGPLAVLMTQHKGGSITRTPLQYVEHLEAAERLQKEMQGKPWPKRMTIARHMRAACAKAGVPVFGMGVMRHSVLTWAHERGAEMAALKEFAHHESEQTTRRFYVDLAVPVNQVPVLRLDRPARRLRVVQR